MTYTFKVGDKGKTRGGDDYEVTAICRHGIVAEYNGDEHIHGCYGTSRVSSYTDLIPPTKRIQGWVNWMVSDNGHVTLNGPHETETIAATEARVFKAHSPGHQRLACIYIDIKEGEGLDHAK